MATTNRSQTKLDPKNIMFGNSKAGTDLYDMFVNERFDIRSYAKCHRTFSSHLEHFYQLQRSNMPDKTKIALTLAWVKHVRENVAGMSIPDLAKTYLLNAMITQMRICHRKNIK